LDRIVCERSREKAKRPTLYEALIIASVVKCQTAPSASRDAEKIMTPEPPSNLEELLDTLTTFSQLWNAGRSVIELLRSKRVAPDGDVTNEPGERRGAQK
jgi:hypothetical protein